MRVSVVLTVLQRTCGRVLRTAAVQSTPCRGMRLYGHFLLTAVCDSRALLNLTQSDIKTFIKSRATLIVSWSLPVGRSCSSSKKGLPDIDPTMPALCQRSVRCRCNHRRPITTWLWCLALMSSDCSAGCNPWWPSPAIVPFCAASDLIRVFPSSILDCFKLLAIQFQQQHSLEDVWYSPKVSKTDFHLRTSCHQSKTQFHQNTNWIKLVLLYPMVFTIFSQSPFLL